MQIIWKSLFFLDTWWTCLTQFIFKHISSIRLCIFLAFRSAFLRLQNSAKVRRAALNSSKQQFQRHSNNKRIEVLQHKKYDNEHPSRRRRSSSCRQQQQPLRKRPQKASPNICLLQFCNPRFYMLIKSYSYNNRLSGRSMQKLFEYSSCTGSRRWRRRPRLCGTTATRSGIKHSCRFARSSYSYT